MVLSSVTAPMLLRLEHQSWNSPSWGHQPLCPSEKQRGRCYFQCWGKSLESKWKWIMRSTGSQHNMYQPSLCWSLIKEASAVAGKGGLCLLSFPASSLSRPRLCTCFFPVETSAFASIPFLEKYTKPQEMIRSFCLQRWTYMGGERINISLRFLFPS